MITAPLDKIAANTQAQDVSASRGPQDVWQDCYRVKAYNKWEDVVPFTHPAQWEFPQPFQVAAARTGKSWEVCNRTFLGQLADCNLACDFCYRGATGPTVDVTPDEYVEAFRQYNKAFPDAQVGVLRISGGEPMLYQEWVAAVLDEGSSNMMSDTEFVWIDTNLTIKPDSSLHLWSRDDGDVYNYFIGVCGCFKPGLWSLGEQIQNASALKLQGADLYFYWPSSDDLSDQAFDNFLAELDAAIPFAPLRLTVLSIKYNYSAVKEKNPDDWEEKHERAQAGLRNRRAQWAQWCANRYPVWMCNAPSHEVRIG